MAQMINNEAPLLTTLSFQEINGGFMRGQDGKIFFLGTVGRQTMLFPVFKNGTICNQADLDAQLELAGKKVSLVHPKHLGITEIRWAN